MQNNNIRLAQPTDVQNIVGLINAAYRSDQGWTHEHDIVTGDRISEALLRELLSQPNFELFILEDQEQLIWCIGLTELADNCEIGSFAIAPVHQNAGHGRILLDFAEDYIKQNSAVKTLKMSVLNVRLELIAYYERRGYKAMGEIEDYSIEASVGEPLVPLKLVILEKTFC